MKVHKIVQGTSDWFQIRSGIPTASMFGSLITPKTLKPAKTDYAHQLAAERLAGWDADDWVGNVHTDHGKESELFAIKDYEDATNQKVEQVGFITPDCGTYGGSPDGLVGDDGIIEIKSLLAKNMIKTYMEWVGTKECPVLYKMQIQGYLMITGRAWCDLVLYHPKLEAKIIRILPDLEIHELLKQQIEIVINERDKIVAEMAGF